MNEYKKENAASLDKVMPANRIWLFKYFPTDRDHIYRYHINGFRLNTYEQ